MPPISFNEIPSALRVPGVFIEFDATRASQGLTLQPYKALLIGQRLPNTQAGVNALQPVRVTNVDTAKSYFGDGSMLHTMAAAWFANNAFTEAWFIALDDATGATKATGAITVSGSPATGTIYLYVAGKKVTIAVTGGETGATTASNIAAAINAVTSLPLTAAVNTTTNTKVDLTAKQAGVAGNNIDLRLNRNPGERTPSGLTVTITPLASGAVNPDTTAVWPVLGDDQYHVIVFPYTDTTNVGTLDDELEDRWGPLRRIEGMAFLASAANLSGQTTLGQGTNSKHVSVMSAYKSPSTPWEWAAAVGANVAYYGAIDPARPFQTLELKSLLGPDPNDQFTLEERNQLLFDGIATHVVGADGAVRIEAMISTYRTNAGGAADTSYLYVNTLLTLSYLRWDFRNYLGVKYPRHKLGQDSKRYGAGQAIMTPSLMKAEAIARFSLWEESGLVEGLEEFKDGMIVEINATNPNRLDVLLTPNLMNQLRIVGVQLSFIS